MSVRGYIELEWRIPWDAKLDTPEKLNKAAEKLASYLREGTLVDVEKRRLPLQSVEVKTSGVDSPYLVFRIEL